MTALARIEPVLSLVTLIDDAARTLTGAHSAAEILDARDKASFAYDAAKKAARLAQARDAHNTVIAAAHRAQARALEIEAGAKRRLADEYDAAQERGEAVGPKGGGDSTVPVRNAATVKDLGLTRKQVHEAREIRDAEEVDPGIVSRTLNEAVDAGEEPTRAKVKRAVKDKTKRKRHYARRQDPNCPTETQHDRDLRMLIGVWDAACDTARQAFLSHVNAH